MNNFYDILSGSEYDSESFKQKISSDYDISSFVWDASYDNRFPKLKDSFSWSNTLIRTIPAPIEKFSIFPSKETATAYALSNKLSYEGQIIAVTENGKQTVYVLDSSDDVSSTGLRRVGVLSALELCGISDYAKTADFSGRLGLSSLSDINGDNIAIQDGAKLSVHAYTAEDFKGSFLSSEGDFGTISSKIGLSSYELKSELKTLAYKDLSDISSNFGKAFVKNPETFLSNGMMYDLSVVKIPIEDYNLSVINNSLSDNTLYVVSSDYIEAYGQQICNLAMNDSENEEEQFLGIAATDRYVNAMISSVQDELKHGLSGKFDLSGNNEVSGSNTFLGNMFVDSIYANQISSSFVSCDFWNIIGGAKNALCSILDKLDDSPYVLEVAIRAKEIIDFGNLSGPKFDWYGYDCTNVVSVANITKNIYDYINPSSPTELPQDFNRMKDICDMAISAIPLGQSKQSLEFRLQNLRRVDSQIMNYVQNLSVELGTRIRNLELSIQTDVGNRLREIENRLAQIESIFSSNTIVTK